MMSIGLIEELLQQSRGSSVVPYFFCQNDDYELNTVESIIKGLIQQLVHQRRELTKSLRDRWDAGRQRFTEDVASWRGLWDILIEMLERCDGSQVYVVVDALDECQGNAMRDFLHTLTRTGLHRNARIKWLLTSRPSDEAERELLTGSGQVLVSLELNAKHISEGVKTYISHKVNELARRCKYLPALREQIQTALENKAEDTYLWVSLVCQQLEKVHPDEALSTIDKLPPSLHPFYDRILCQISKGERDDVHGCIHLLKSMLLAYRPLKMLEVRSVASLTAEEDIIHDLIARCASLIKVQGGEIEFVHGRDYLMSHRGQAILNCSHPYGHGDTPVRCLSQLCDYLGKNLLGSPRPDSTPDFMNQLCDDRARNPLTSLAYAATFWFRHLEATQDTAVIQAVLDTDGLIHRFLHTKFLEWLECLTFVNQLQQVMPALIVLSHVIRHSAVANSLLPFIQDATRFVQRHYSTFRTWPLQIYSSAVMFSPETSIVKRYNIGKYPHWVIQGPKMEDSWGPLIQTLVGDSICVEAVAFSFDGARIASGLWYGTVKVWNAKTGDVEKTLRGHSNIVYAVAFSPDGRRIASGAADKTIKVWNTETGAIERTLRDHVDVVTSVVFLSDEWRIVSGSRDHTIKVWDARKGEVERTLRGHSDSVEAVTFSPDRMHIASGSWDHTITVWDARKSEVERTLTGHSSCVHAVAFSPDGRRMASGSGDRTIVVWDARKGEVKKTLVGHSNSVTAVAFSPDGRRIASGSYDGTINVWNAKTGAIKRTLRDHGSIIAVAFSPDRKCIASGSGDGTLVIWDARKGEMKETLWGHSIDVTAVAFSPDGRRIASGSSDTTIKVWNARTGTIEQTLTGHFQLTSITNLQFSSSGRHVLSNVGCFPVEPNTETVLVPDDGAAHLHVQTQCIFCDGNPILRLLDSPSCYSVRGKQLAVGFLTGRVMSLP